MKYEKRTIEKVEVSVFRGYPIISVPLSDGTPFTFGVKKAEAILEYLEDIKKFVEEST